MTEIMLQHICSNTIPDNQTSEVLNETVEMFLELDQVPQIPHISNRLNKKRKKDPLSKSEGKTQKKTKVTNQDNENDIDIDDIDIVPMSFSTINTDAITKQLFMASETGENNTNSSVCQKKYFSSNEESWYNNLNKVKEYIDENKKRPSKYDKDKEIKRLGDWICNQQKNYKNKKDIMKEDKIYTEWTNFRNEYEEYQGYQGYFLSNEESWYNNLNKIKEYIDNNKKRPSKHDKDKEIKQLGCWIGNQQNNYKKREHNMKDNKIYNEWNNFTNEYKEYLDNNKKRPSKKNSILYLLNF